MAVAYANLRTIIQRDIADSSNATAVDQAIDQAQREIARLRKWPELMTRAFVNTTAPYEGTSAITVEVTNASTTVTLTGGTWPTDIASGLYRFALSLSDPWYGVATRSSGTIILLAQAYQDDSDTSTDFIAHKPHISLASAVDRVESIWLHQGGEAHELVNAATDEHLTSFEHYHSGPGVPTHYLNIERDASGNRQILLGPETCDDVYRLEYVYRRKTTDGTLTANLDESRWPLIACRAKAILYEAEQYDRSLQEMQRFEKLLRDEWASENESETSHVRIGQSRVSYPGRRDIGDEVWSNGDVGPVA